jgi:hypothetical protein
MNSSPSTRAIWCSMTRAAAALGLMVAVLLWAPACHEPGDLGGDLPDGVIGLDIPNVPPGDAPVVPNTTGNACISDLDCATGTTSLCGPFVVCLNYVCTADPTTLVDCTSADPCLDGACDPVTGSCSFEDVCECVMADVPLTCGDTVSWAASDAQPPFTEVDGVACGVPYGAGVKRAWKFTATSNEPVFIQSTGGAISSVSALVSPFGGCEPNACMDRDERAVVFQPAMGATYAVVVEHVHPIASDSFELKVTCGAAVSETVCDDGIDEDFDGGIDCMDPDCIGQPGCPDAVETDCANGEDDDNNGLSDCAEPFCTFATACLQACQPQLAASCGFSQGLTTGGGKANASDYTCGPVAPGKEVVYSFEAKSTGVVGVTSGATQGGVYIMEAPAGTDTCSPKYCIAYGLTEAWFATQPFKKYFIAIDGPANADFSFEIGVECFE